VSEIAQLIIIRNDNRLRNVNVTMSMLISGVILLR